MASRTSPPRKYPNFKEKQCENKVKIPIFPNKENKKLAARRLSKQHLGHVTVTPARIRLLTTCTEKGENGHISSQKQSNRSKSDKGGVTDKYRIEERRRITSQNTYAINLRVTHGNDLSEQLGNRKSKVGLHQKGVLKSIGKHTDKGIGLKDQGIPNKSFSGPLAIFRHKKN